MDRLYQAILRCDRQRTLAEMRKHSPDSLVNNPDLSIFDLMHTSCHRRDPRFALDVTRSYAEPAHNVNFILHGTAAVLAQGSLKATYQDINACTKTADGQYDEELMADYVLKLVKDLE